jgi:hypothetical protein
MTRSLLTFAFACTVFISSAQVKIGNGVSNTVDPSAVLELSNDLASPPSTWKTFLPPQVDFTNPVFTSAGVWGVAGSPVTGAVVFNAGLAFNNGFSGPGLYFWNGHKWSGVSMGFEDKLRRSLTTSTLAYDTAIDNSWVMITEAEYNNLLITVGGAAKYAANDSFMNLSATNGWNQLYTVGGNASVSLIPPSSYIIAWSVRTGLPFPSTSLNSKVKVSSSQLTGYTDYGLPMPGYDLTTDTRYYFILKKPSASTPAVPCYTAIFTFMAKFLGNRPVAPGRDYFAVGDSPTLTNSYTSQSSAQFICTQAKQW